MGGDDYLQFLAARILHDREPITFRLLSRELKIHNALAKQYLYAFYTSSKTTHPGKVHATYLISGLKREPQTSNEDSLMTDASSPTSTLEDSELTEDHVNRTTFEIVQEDDLENAKSTFERIDVVHMYSLEPEKLSDDLIVLADCGRRVMDIDLTQQPSEISKLYGSVEQQLSQRDLSRNPVPVVAQNAIQKAPATQESVSSISKLPAKPTARVQKNQLKVTSSPSPSPFSAKPNIEIQSGKTTDAKLTEGRLENDDAESKAVTKNTLDNRIVEDKLPPVKVATVKSEQLHKELPAKPKRTEISQELMGMFASDEENDGNEGDLSDTPDVRPKGTGDATENTGLKDEDLERSNREPSAPKLESTGEDVLMTEAPELGESQIPDISAVSEKDTKTSSRRGRRKVERTIEVKGEDGFTVIKNVTEWESYSESSDVEPSTTKPVVKKSVVAPSKEKSSKKKGSGKAGQTSLMNFFKK